MKKTLSLIALAASSLASVALAVNGESDKPSNGTYAVNGGPSTMQSVNNGNKVTHSAAGGQVSAVWKHDAGSGVYERSPGGGSSTPTLCFAETGPGSYNYELVDNNGNVTGTGSISM